MTVNITSKFTTSILTPFFIFQFDFAFVLSSQLVFLVFNILSIPLNSSIILGLLIKLYLFMLKYFTNTVTTFNICDLLFYFLTFGEPNTN